MVNRTDRSGSLRRRFCLPVLSLLAAVLVGGLGSGWAQVTSAISGTVVDTSGAAIEGATVTVKNPETGATRVATTDAAGAFKVLALSVGPQEVKAEKPGFQAALRLGIHLQVGQDAVVNLVLQIGGFAQQVTVSAEAPVVNTTTAPVSGVVGEREVKDLPLNGRSFDNLITLNPGTVNYVLKSAGTATSNGNTFSVAGRRPMDNLVLLNGIEYGGTSQLAVTPGGVSGELLGIDAVREFNVQTDTYDAEYGKRAGAQVSVVTQSGSNALHGSVFEFLRNSALDQPGLFDQGVVPPFRRNQFGGALGGPLRKNRLFLFGNYEGFRQSLALSNVSVVPDEAARQGYLPNAGIELLVPNLNGAMLPYTSFWPQPNGAELLVKGLPTGTALAYNNPKEPIREDFGTVRTDYIVRDRDSLSGAYTLDDGKSLTPLADPLFASLLALRMQVASVQETHIVSPAVLNTFRVGFSRAGFNYNSFSQQPFAPGLSFVSGAGPEASSSEVAQP